ncbi:hypothetical protein BCR42DRAFT_414771 [Absidia repens]|uniref:Uncharacterized protein n=1 Tax=Absidia repens TaxID=90262 RepID=A0A1X2IGW2_9FUNG|nr:hypothetical protein BCR42DRAFT_414771 [Absidia repens]
MVEKSRMTLQKLARWHPGQSNSVHDRKDSAALWEGSLQPLEHEDLKQGALYIIKIHRVSVGLFQGWNDDMCCFTVLRSENEPLRWSHARYLPGDFDAFDAFDEAGNPPVHLWTRFLHVDVPVNWFVIFEEARRKQREWTAHVFGQQQQQQQQQEPYHHDPASIGTNAGLQPGMVIGGHPHHQLQQQPFAVDEDYSDHDTFSAAPSQYLRSERMSSISSLQLPLDARPDENIQMQPPPTTSATVHVYSPPHSSIAANIPPSPASNQYQSSINETNQPHLSDAPLQPSDKYNTASSVQPMVTKYNETNHQISGSQPHTTSSSSLPNVTTETQIPSLSPTTLTNQQPTTMRSSPLPTPKQMEIALDELSFPHDDDQFSIHSDYQPNINAPDSSITEDQPNSSSNNSNWKKRSIKKMLSRSSNIAK